MRRTSVAAVLGVMAGAINGCTAPVVIGSAGFGALQSGTEAFIRGELEAAVAHPMPEVYAAAEAAVNELRFALRASKLDEFKAYVRAKETRGRKIDIDLENKSPVVTKISIRVGIFGDQAIARLILSHIQERLGPTSLHSVGPVP